MGSKRVVGKKLRVEVTGKELVPIEKLEPFQGALKHIEKTEYENLRANLLEHGISFVVHAWKNKGRFYIIDGHQRVFTMSQMKEIEGFEIPDIPIAEVKAKSFEEAKRKVLAAASQYGKMTRESLATYLKENDIPFDEVVSKFHFPEIDYAKMMEEFQSQIDGMQKNDPEEVEGSSNKPPSGSALVKQLQLYFTIEDYNQFVNCLEALQEKYNKDNISDTVLEVVREAYRTYDKGE
jgi:hypothetical protein